MQGISHLKVTLIHTSWKKNNVTEALSRNITQICESTPVIVTQDQGELNSHKVQQNLKFPESWAKIIGP